MSRVVDTENHGFRCRYETGNTICCTWFTLCVPNIRPQASNAMPCPPVVSNDGAITLVDGWKRKSSPRMDTGSEPDPTG